MDARYQTILVVLTCAGCSVTNAVNTDRRQPTTHVDTVRFVPTDSETRVPPQFRLVPEAFSVETKVLEWQSAYSVHSVRFSSAVSTQSTINNTVHAEYYTPTTEKPRSVPACVLLHGLGGEFTLMRAVAKKMAKNGVAALVLQLPHYGNRRDPDSPKRLVSYTPELTVLHVSQTVFDVRRAVSWLATRSEVDKTRLGIAGFSMGGMISVLAAAAEPRLGKLAVFLGGGDLANTVWTHPNSHATEFRESWMQRGGTQHTLSRALAPIEPISYARLVRDRDVLFVGARYDGIIPAASSQALAAALGPTADVHWISAGHLTSLIFFGRETDRLIQFLKL